MVRALASLQCGPGSIPRLGVICGLSLFVFYSATRGFFPGTLVFPCPQKPTFDLICVSCLFSIHSVPNKCSSTRTTRHLNKVSFLSFLSCSAKKIPFNGCRSPVLRARVGGGGGGNKHPHPFIHEGHPPPPTPRRGLCSLHSLFTYLYMFSCLDLNLRSHCILSPGLVTQSE